MLRKAAHSGDVMRLVQYNVRRCIDPASNEPSGARVLASIQRLSPTILTLNEVDTTKCERLLHDLAGIGLRHQSFFGHVRNGQYGNALLSTEPLRDVVHTHLDGGSVVRAPSGEKHRIARGLLSASTSVLGCELRVAVTHLDHMSSEQRREQMHHVLRTLGEPAASTTQLLVGDLNALRRDDYSEGEWAAHAAHNAAKGWVGPYDDAAGSGCLDALADAGFVDCVATLAHRPQQREWPAPPWTAHARVVGGPRYRIDYAWLRNPADATGRRLVPLSTHVEHSCGGASDHQPVVVDFEALAFDAGE